MHFILDVLVVLLEVDAIQKKTNYYVIRNRSLQVDDVTLLVLVVLVELLVP